MSDEERNKQYLKQREADDLTLVAHMQFKDYMCTIGQSARLHRQTAINQAERDLNLNEEISETKHLLNDFIDRCIEYSKRDKTTGRPIPYAHGSRIDEDNTSGTAWAVYLKDDIPSDICTDPTKNDELAYELTGWTRYYRGAGRLFEAYPSVRVSRTRVLVKQFRGLDI